MSPAAQLRVFLLRNDPSSQSVNNAADNVDAGTTSNVEAAVAPPLPNPSPATTAPNPTSQRILEVIDHAQLLRKLVTLAIHESVFHDDNAPAGTT